MNEFIQTMHTRRSVRSFDTEKQISEETLNDILLAARQSPTYAGGQQYSIIVVDDIEKKEKLVALTAPSSGKGMTFIKEAPIFLLFVIDFSKINETLKTENKQMLITDSLESLLIGTVDIGIATEAVTAAAESLGLGAVVVGAIRRDTEALIEIFNLPKYCFPIVGVALGYPSSTASSNITPRLPLETLVHKNTYTYNKESFIKALQSYNETMNKHFSQRGQEGLTWSKLMSIYYGKEFSTPLKDILKKQGFELKR